MADNPVVPDAPDVPDAPELAEAELPEWAIEGDIIPQTGQKLPPDWYLLPPNHLADKCRRHSTGSRSYGAADCCLFGFDNPEPIMMLDDDDVPDDPYLLVRNGDIHFLYTRSFRVEIIRAPTTLHEIIEVLTDVNSGVDGLDIFKPKHTLRDGDCVLIDIHFCSTCKTWNFDYDRPVEPCPDCEKLPYVEKEEEEEEEPLDPNTAFRVLTSAEAREWAERPENQRDF